jgi:glycerol-3-phosphate acyltransferase PlsX
MGGDHGPCITVPAAIQALNTCEDLSLELIGSGEELQPYLDNAACPEQRLRIRSAGASVAMDEAPLSALRTRTDSSMRLAIDAVASGEARACVSGGNTGALMAMAHTVLKPVAGIDRAAICTSIPTTAGSSLLLDMGANVDCSAVQLHQFALMGSVMAALTEGLDNPTCALLNNGSEANKGNSLVREAAELCAADESLNYLGFVEGDELFFDKADVIVCDGFTGNIALKVSEGTARFIRSRLEKGLGADFAGGSMGELGRELDPDQHNGACFLGLNGLVVKSHGGAGQKAFEQAIVTAYQLARMNLVGQLKEKLAESAG